jgi:hypothetical protein
MSLQRVQAETTSSEFLRWMLFLEQEEIEKVQKCEFYYAAMIAEIRRSWVCEEQRELVDARDFIIRPKSNNSVEVKSKNPVEVKSKKTEEQEVKEYTERSKGHWFKALGLNKEKKNG